MKLSDWMAEHDVSDPQLAARIDRSRPTVSRIRRGLIRPDWETMDRISDATDGAVTPNDFAFRAESESVQ